MIFDIEKKYYISNKIKKLYKLKSENRDNSNHWFILEFLGDLINNIIYTLKDGVVLRSSELFENNKKIQLIIAEGVKEQIDNSTVFENYEDNYINWFIDQTLDLNVQEGIEIVKNRKYIENYTFFKLLTENKNNYKIVDSYKQMLNLIVLIIANIKNSWKGEYILSNNELFENNKKIQIFYINELIKEIKKSNVDEEYLSSLWEITDYL